MGIVKAKELIQDADIRSKRYMEKVIEETGFLGYSVSEKSFRVVCDRIKKKYYRIGVIHRLDIKAKTIEKRVEHVKNKYCGCKKGINM